MTGGPENGSTRSVRKVRAMQLPSAEPDNRSPSTTAVVTRPLGATVTETRALACGKPAIVDVQVDPAALYSFRRDSFKHRDKTSK